MVKMKISLINIDDIQQLVEIASIAHQESKYRDLPFSGARISKTFHEHVQSSEMLALKAVSDQISGFFLAEIGGMIFTEQKIAMETSYYVLPKYRGTRAFYLLISAFKEWADDKKLPQFCMPHFAKDNNKTYSALEKMDFSEAGRIYKRGI